MKLVLVTLLALALAGGAAAARPVAKPAPGVAVVGHGIRAMVAPGMGAAQLANGTLIFGLPHERVKPGAPIKNVLVAPGKPPQKLVARDKSGNTVFSDGVAGTTVVALGVGMKTWDGVLTDVTTTATDGAWKISAGGHETEWPAGQRLVVSDDGATFTLAK